MAPEHAAHRRSRAIWLYVPQPGRWWLWLIAMGTIASWALSYVVILVCLSGFEDQYGDIPTWAYVAAVVGALIGPAIWFPIVLGWRRGHIQNRRPFRQARLHYACLSPQSWSRMPHRHVEQHYRNDNLKKNDLVRLMRNLSPGGVYVVSSDPVGGATAVPVVPFAFEPIEIDGDLERLEQLAVGFTEPEADSTDDNSPLGSGRATLARMIDTVRTFSRSGFAQFAVLLTIWVYTILRSPSERVMLIGLTVALAYTVGRSLLLSRQWWIVPGGLLMRESAAWRRGEAQFRLIARHASPLILDWGADEAYILDRDVILTVPCSEPYAVLAGWLSTARTPTVEEARTLLQARQVEY